MLAASPGFDIRRVHRISVGVPLGPEGESGPSPPTCQGPDRPRGGGGTGTPPKSKFSFRHLVPNIFFSFPKLLPKKQKFSAGVKQWEMTSFSEPHSHFFPPGPWDPRVLKKPLYQVHYHGPIFFVIIQINYSKKETSRL